MKKFLKILFFIIIILLIAIFAAPYLFKGKIIAIANEQLEKNLNAKASFRNINLSLLRNFPNLSIRLENLSVTGIEEFEGDTLVDIQGFNIVVDAISAIKMENIEIKRILIDECLHTGIQSTDGKKVKSTIFRLLVCNSWRYQLVFLILFPVINGAINRIFPINM